MKINNGVVEFISEGGIGSAAEIIIELRTIFPGIGGILITREGVATALRKEIKNIVPGSGHNIFLKHVIIKRLDDYFYRIGKYTFSHIPRPLGSISIVGKDSFEGYLYEWAFGIDGFGWPVDLSGNLCTSKLHDWDKFVMSFSNVGIDLSWDTSDPDNASVTKNIVSQYSTPIGPRGEMSSLWKRIDFGDESIKIDYNKLSSFLSRNRDHIINVLRTERYVMMRLAMQYLTRKNKMREIDIGRLEVLIGDYRRAMLSHYAMGFGPSITPVRYEKIYFSKNRISFQSLI